MTQQSHSQAYTLRKPWLKKTHVSHHSTQHYLEQLEHGSNLDVHQHPHEWIKKLWYIHTMEYYSAIKRNTFASVLMRWMNLEPIIQSEASQKEKDKHRILTHIHEIQKNITKGFIYRAPMAKQIQRIELRTWGEGVTWKLTLPCVKQIANRNLLYGSGNSKRHSVSTQRGGMRRELGGRFKREGMDIYVPMADSC